MKVNREYDIAFVGLKPGIHEFNYIIEDSFFDVFEKPEFRDAHVEVKMTMDKKQGTFLLHFNINGTVKLPCDRCGDEFELMLWDEFDLVVKQIDDDLLAEKTDEDAEVAYIGRSESLLKVAGWIYEFVILSVPMQHIHPDDSEGKSTCNPIALKFLSQETEKPNASIWADLKKKLND